jgi:hypothetical protein
MAQFKKAGMFLEEETRKLAIIAVKTVKTPLVRPMRDDVVFGSPEHQRSPDFWLAMVGWILAWTWFTALLWLFTH